MEQQTTRNRTTFAANIASFTSGDRTGELTQQRLEFFLRENAETERRKTLFNSEREKIEADLMKNPISSEKAFAYFGLLLGIFTPAAMFIRFFINAGIYRGEDFWILGVFLIVNFLAAATAYFSGKFIGKIVRDLESVSWSKMILTLPFIGLFWGIMAGGAGGIIVFVIGAFFGALLGAIVGGIALPVFTVFHRLLKRGDKIDGKHFLPLAAGVTFVISAFFLGI